MMIAAVGGADGLEMNDLLFFFSPNFFCALDLTLCINRDVPEVCVMYSMGHL